MIKLAIIIPIFNALEYTKKCLGFLKEPIALPEKEKYETHIVVVDDGSTDGSSDWIRINFPDVILCKGDGNLWWSGGVNMGIKHALKNLHTEYILLWNNDVRPASNYFSSLYQLLESNPPENIVLSKVYVENSKEDIVLSMGGFFNPYSGKHYTIGFGKKDTIEYQKKQAVDWFPGMGTSIHKSIFSKVGYFDEINFPQYHGDADYGLRAKEAGYTLTVYPELKIWNDRDNTGYSNDKSFGLFIKSLTSKKSNKNIYRDYLFYRKHGKTPRVYLELIRKYFYHIGGFIKWKFLGFFGLKRKNRY